MGGDILVLRPDRSLPASVTVLGITRGAACLCVLIGVWEWRRILAHFPTQGVSWIVLVLGFGAPPALFFRRSTLAVDATCLWRRTTFGPMRSWPITAYASARATDGQVELHGAGGPLCKASPDLFGYEALAGFIGELTTRRARALGHPPPPVRAGYRVLPGTDWSEPAGPGPTPLLLRPTLRASHGRFAVLFGAVGAMLLIDGVVDVMAGAPVPVAAAWLLGLPATLIAVVSMTVPRLIADGEQVTRRTMLGRVLRTEQLAVSAMRRVDDEVTLVGAGNQALMGIGAHQWAPDQVEALRKALRVPWQVVEWPWDPDPLE